MDCRKIEIHLRENPGLALSKELQDHAARCRECSLLWQEQGSLDDTLRALPQAELPPYLGSRTLARLEGRQADSGKQMYAPGWLSLAAPAMALVVAFSALVMRYEYRPRPISQPDNHMPEQNGTLSVAGPAQSLQKGDLSQVYPVWPADQDVIARQDLAIMASLYPDNPGKVQLLLDGIDVSSEAVIDCKYVSYDPKSLGSGEHMVKVILQRADGSVQTASWSFYLLEERS